MEHLEWVQEDMDLDGAEDPIMVDMVVDMVVDMEEGLEVEDEIVAGAKDGNPEVVKGQAMSDVSNPVHNAFLRVVKSSGRNDWVLGLPYHLLERHGGLEIAQLRNHKDQRKIRKANGDQYILVMEEFPAQLKCAKKLDDAHRIDLLIRGLVVESRLGDGLSMPRAVFVACKVGGLYASNSVMFAERALTGQETRPES
ncbi:hypothetical protein APSETT445_005988 [Aspergillus pseudonomiae]